MTIAVIYRALADPSVTGEYRGDRPEVVGGQKVRERLEELSVARPTLEDVYFAIEARMDGGMKGDG